MSGTDAEADGPLAELEGRADGAVEGLRGVCIEDVTGAALGGGCRRLCCGAGRGGVGRQGAGAAGQRDGRREYGREGEVLASSRRQLMLGVMTVPIASGRYDIRAARLQFSFWPSPGSWAQRESARMLMPGFESGSTSETSMLTSLPSLVRSETLG